MILCSNPKAQYLAYQDEIDRAIKGVFNEGRYILGEQVKLFEEEFARYIGVKYAIGVGSGTEALHIALKVCGVNAGDEVITVSHTAVATVAAIALTGAVAVLVDIEPESYNMDPSKLEAAITSKTKAIIVVHLYGHPADMVPIIQIARERGIRVIEDCAQAHGAMYEGKRVGAWGDMACFSFYPTKNLGSIGDGGAIVTNDDHLAEQCSMLREYGWSKERVSQIPGWNSRLDELQAAILRVKLRFLDQDNASRIALAKTYHQTLSKMELISPVRRKSAEHMYHLYVIRTSKRDALKEYLAEQGIQAMIHYPVPVHQQSGFRGLVRLGGLLTETESAVKEILSLPLYPQLQQAELLTTAKAIKEFFKRHEK